MAEAVLTPQALQELRQSLPVLSQGESLSPSLQAFCQFYKIDFSQRLPDVQHRVGTVPAGNYSLAVHCWTQPGARSNLLLVHGYTDHVGLFGHLVEYGLRRGCNVIAFDLPGHGLSSGDPVTIDDFADYECAIASVLAAGQVPVLPWWVMAQSTGCAALIEYSRTHPWPFVATVFMAPLIRPAGWRRVELAYLLLHRFKQSVPRSFTNNSGDKAFLAFVKSDPLQSRTISMAWLGALRRWLAGLSFRDLGLGSVLVLQGDNDGTVDWRYNMKKIARLLPQGQIEYLSGGGHHLANETADLRRQYFGLIDEYLNQPETNPDLE
jgi:alpha-beta hydrolase superfamily lysophospholipase